MKRTLSFSILISFVFLFSAALRAEDLKISERNLKFTVVHPFKTVNGICKTVNVTPATYFTGGIGVQIPKSVKIEAPLKDFQSGDPNRDSHILESLGYPEQENVSFTSTSIDPIEGGWNVTGNLTINGVTKQIKTKVSVLNKGDGQIEVSGKFQIKMKEFNVDPPGVLFVKAKEEVEIEFSFLLKP
ncbi:YceI family protein [Leptospira fletcheri]|uniref:YceI family protein n=1 Tax=Leptospira fletcheri TaxID=2484981 RepID=A0A4R9GJQ3_9LEPT|nr:YceI family protein [Leptospira fletcheri]TGK13799.1 YceI family protein [Leptospira fletcheri]